MEKTPLLIKPSLSGRDHALSSPYAREMRNFSYIIADQYNSEAWFVDPAWDLEGLLKQIDELECRLKGVLLTHSHPDHCGGQIFGICIPGIDQLPELLEQRGEKMVPIYLHADELGAVAAQNAPVSKWLFPLDPHQPITIGDETLQCFHTPGHTRGGVSYLLGDALFSGDTLFWNGHGRTDLDGGDQNEMDESLRQLYDLIEQGAKLYPGHDY